MAKRVISAMGCKRPTTDFARVASKKMGNPRYKGENILQLELELPVRTTRDYQGPTIAPRVQAALDQALLPQEGDLEVDAEYVNLMRFIVPLFSAVFCSTAASVAIF